LIDSDLLNWLTLKVTAYESNYEITVNIGYYMESQLIWLTFGLLQTQIILYYHH